MGYNAIENESQYQKASQCIPRGNLMYPNESQ